MRKIVLVHLDVAPVHAEKTKIDFRGTRQINMYVSNVTLILVVFSTMLSSCLAAQICSDACDYREDGSCDDGGPNADYKGCRLGSDCVDCGVRESDIYSEKAKYHRLGRFDTLYKLQQKYGYKVPAIMRWNNIWNVKDVEPGMVLAVNPAASVEIQNKILTAENKKRLERVKSAGRVLALEKLFGKRLKGYISALQSTANAASKPVCKTPTYEELTKDPLPMIEEPFLSFAELHEKYKPNEADGWWSPETCEAMDTVAIIIPYRNREHYLQGFLQRMHPLLRKQLLRYQIFVIDQSGEKKFNRAKLLNVGAVEAASVVPLKKAVGKGYRFCFVMHDVDMLSLSDGLPYNCPKEDEGGPRHLSVYTVSHRKKCLYKELFGGVAALSYQQFTNVNGYSNKYFGWGGEDDDMSSRIRIGAGMKIIRPKACSGPCRVFSDCMKDMGIIKGYDHVEDEHYGLWYMMGGKVEDVRDKSMNPDNMEYLVFAEQRYMGEGLNTLSYERIAKKQAYFGLYSHIKVLL